MSEPYNPYDYILNPPNTPFNRAMERTPKPQSRWEEVLPQGATDAIKGSPLFAALQSYFGRRSFDDYAKEQMGQIQGQDPISRIADGKEAVAGAFPEPTALDRFFGRSDAHGQLGAGVNLLANFIGPAAPKVPARSAAAPPSAPARAAEAPQGIRAYHGSPYDFDKFDITKIGTGEGAQAFGRGLYFAEKEAVAKQYRDALAPEARINGKPPNYDDPIHWAAVALHDNNGSVHGAIESMKRWLGSSFPEDRKTIAAAIEAVGSGRLPRQMPEVTGDRGRMYEVNINADPAKFLDWDKPFSGQSESVRRALLETGRAAAARGSFPKSDAQMLQAIQESSRPLGGHGGSGHLKDLRNLYGNRLEAELRDAGVKGVRYKDAMSRRADDGTSNYVVFDDSIITILRKYGLLPPVAAGAAMSADSQEPGQ